MTDERPTDVDVPIGLRIGAAYGWRILVVLAVGAVALWGLSQIKLIVIPVLVALLLTALLWQPMQFFLKHKVPKWLATVLVLLLTAGLVTVLLWLVQWQVRTEWPTVEAKSIVAFEGFVEFLTNFAHRFGFDPADVTSVLDDVWGFIQEQSQVILNASLALGSAAGQGITGLILSLFILVCFLADGGSIWRWLVQLFPKKAQAAVGVAGANGWHTVVNYARTQTLVATVDAVGIAVGAWLLGVPLAVPIGVLVFLGSFVPIVGAILTGSFAVLLALVYNGFWNAVLMLLVVLLVQQIEGNVLQPLLMRMSVKMHPLAVVLVIAAGTMLAGIPGALFAVPIAAFVNVAWLTISRGTWRTGELPAAESLLWYTVDKPKGDGSLLTGRTLARRAKSTAAKPKSSARTLTKKANRKKPEQ